MLEIDNVSLRYNTQPVLSGINLSINQGEIVCLLGESGSGKTTLLRVIAGLEEDYSGSIRVNSKAIEKVPTHKRGFGLMFQDFALFPHMSVAKNVAFGLRMRGVSAQEQSKIVAEMLDLVDLQGYQERNVDTLSGGQQQRVALARSLAPRPQLLMLDEPLGSLDAGLRERLVLNIRRIIKTIGLTTIYVTHDQQESYAIADRVAIMNNGQIEQYDTPEILYRHPKTVFIARFLGLTNLVPKTFIQQYSEIASRTDTSTYLLHPQSLALDETGLMRAKVVERVFQGDRYRLKLAVNQDIILTTSVSFGEYVPNENETVTVSINPDFIEPLSESQRSNQA